MPGMRSDVASITAHIHEDADHRFYLVEGGRQTEIKSKKKSSDYVPLYQAIRRISGINRRAGDEIRKEIGDGRKLLATVRKKRPEYKEHLGGDW